MASLQDNALALAERAAEVQAILHDQEIDAITTNEALRRIRAVMVEEGLLRAMHEVGYFPPDTPPPGTLGH